MLRVIFTFRSKEYGRKKKRLSHKRGAGSTVWQYPGCHASRQKLCKILMGALHNAQFQKENNESTRNGLNAASDNKFVALHLSIQFLDLCVPSSNRRAQ